MLSRERTTEQEPGGLLLLAGERCGGSWTLVFASFQGYARTGAKTVLTTWERHWTRLEMAEQLTWTPRAVTVVNSSKCPSRDTIGAKPQAHEAPSVWHEKIDLPQRPVEADLSAVVAQVVIERAMQGLAGAIRDHRRSL